MRRKGKNVYAIYDGDVFVDLGTDDELAKRLNIKQSTVHSLATPYKRKLGKRMAIKVEVEEL